jgi:hypothetical protein
MKRRVMMDKDKRDDIIGGIAGFLIGMIIAYIGYVILMTIII